MSRRRRRYDGPPKQDGIVWVKLFSAGVSDAEFDRVVEDRVRECLAELREQIDDNPELTAAQRAFALTKAEPLIRTQVRADLTKGRMRLLH